MDVVDAGKKVMEKVLNQFGDTPIKAIPEEIVTRGREAMESVLEEYGSMPIRILNSATFKDELRDAFPDVNDELDTTFLLELLYYFPIDKTYISAGSYDQYLYDLEKTVIDNYSVGNFQVSFFYAHLIFMSYVYYCVERAYQFEPGRMTDIFYPINSYRGRNDKPDIEHLGSVYEFSKIPEKDIFKVFHVLGMEDAVIKEFSNYISSRDDYAHATGHGNLSEDEFRRSIKTVVGNMSTLHDLFVPRIQKLYIDFMLERLECEYDLILDNFNDFVFDNSLSINDLDYLCHLGVKKLQESNATLKAEYQATRNIHCAFIEYCMENDGIEPPAGYLSLRNEKYLFFRYKGNATQYVENELGISAYTCAKDGGRFPVFECVNCGEEQLVYDAGQNKYHCFACNKDFAGEKLGFCSNCGSIIDVCRFIVGELYERADQRTDAGTDETPVLFSLVGLFNAYKETRQLDIDYAAVTLDDISDALLYLSKIGAMKLEGGFLVSYNAMEIKRLVTDNRIKYKVDDYRMLDEFYKQKIQQIHIVGEYANLMVQNYFAALQFVQDYFQMDFRRFISKYFRGERAKEINRNITPQKYHQLFGELSDIQFKIINDNESKYIVVAAGPGSGKTRVLVHKLASLLLLEDVKHEQLLMLTFSRAAATEFKKRLLGLIGNAANFVEIKTFHSYCFDLLGKIGSLEGVEDVVKNAAEMIQNGEVEPGRIMKSVLVIDEAQDMDEHEFALVQALIQANDDMRVIAVGDDDQNIYEFRGSNSKHKRTVVFCASVKHAEQIAELFQEVGINAASVSGGMKQSERKEFQDKFVNREIQVLCACDLLNEGWDCPEIEVLFMARPTMSKVLYTQQLGRGMRLYPGKESLMVFDFVDNASQYNMPQSLHRLFKLKEYKPGQLAVAPGAQKAAEAELYARGEKPEALIDWPVDATDYELVDIFNWQEEAEGMISQMEFVRRVDVQAETIERYVRECILVPDLVVPMSEHRTFKYFKEETIEKYAQQYGWTLIDDSNRKDMFMDMIRQMDMSYSYKPVLVKAILLYADEKGRIKLDDIVSYFRSYYEGRRASGLPVEKKNSIFAKGGYTDKEAERNILANPFKRFEDMQMLRHTKTLGIVQVDESVWKRLTTEEKTETERICDEKLDNYYARLK